MSCILRLAHLALFTLPPMAGRGYGVTMTTESGIRAMITAADERHNGRPRIPHLEKKAQEAEVHDASS